MKKLADLLLSLLKKRLFWNIFFWAAFLFMWRHDLNIDYKYPRIWYYFFAFLFTFILAGLSYFNNLVLIPHFLAKRKYWVYVLSILACTFLAAVGTAGNYKIMQYYFPKIEIWQVFYITTNVPNGYTLSALLSGAVNYFFFLLTWVSIFTMAWYSRDYSRQARLIEESRKKQVEMELSFLKNQINPHFLFNTLNNLYSLALKKSDSAPDAILKLSSILRYLLYESNGREISFEKEKEIMQAYIGLELLRMADKESISFSISADKDYKIPPLLWLPILENLFKHGTRYISEKHFLEYNFSITDNKLSIHSRNEFKPVNGNENVEKAEGIGLNNLRKRLELLYDGRYIIHTNMEGNYYITDVLIKL